MSGGLANRQHRSSAFNASATRAEVREQIESYSRFLDRGGSPSSLKGRNPRRRIRALAADLGLGRIVAEGRGETGERSLAVGDC